MAITGLRNKWITFFCVVVIVAGTLYAYNYYVSKKHDDQLTADCQNKKYYGIPMISFADRDSSDIKNTIVEIRREGRRVTSELGLKPSLNANGLIDLELYGKSTANPSLHKQDTIIIAIKNEKHILYGFNSNTIKVDHGFLLCHESYEMDGKPFNSDRPNSIVKR